MEQHQHEDQQTPEGEAVEAVVEADAGVETTGIEVAEEGEEVKAEEGGMENPAIPGECFLRVKRRR